jgi:hypothetical protein
MLLSVAGCFGTPAANIAIPGSSYSVVWPDKSAGKPVVPKREIAESREVIPQPAEDALQILAKTGPPAPAVLLDPSLFQRPPPTFPSRP